MILFMIMLIIYLTEQQTNSSINSFFDAFWYTLVTITTVGYGDITPESTIGRLAALILLIAGVAIFGAFSGKFASVLFDQQRKKSRGLIQLKKLKDHFLICGWKPGFEKILSDVLDANPDIPNELIVLVNSASETEMERILSLPVFAKINYIAGDYTDEDVLLRAKIKTAERALVISDYSQNFSELEIDSRTVLAVLTMKNLNFKLYTAAELIDSKFEKHLSLAHCDEVILSNEYQRNLLVQASSGQGLSHVLRELITKEADAGLILKDVEEECFFKTYAEYRQMHKSKAVLVGILENTGNFYLRRREALAEAQKNPNMEQIVANLKKVKALQSNKPVLTPDDDYIIQPNSRAIFIKGHSSSVEKGDD